MKSIPDMLSLLLHVLNFINDDK